MYKFLLTMPLLMSFNLIVADDSLENKEINELEEIQNNFSQISKNQDNLSNIKEYANAIKIQKEKINKINNNAFKEKALKLLDDNILLSNALIDQKIINIEISDIRSLLNLSKKILSNVKNSLITQSVDAETNRINKIYQDISSLLISKIDNLLSYDDLSITESVSDLDKIDEDLNKIINKLKVLVSSNHPLLLTCIGVKYFLKFAIMNIDANNFLLKNEDKIKQFYDKGVSIFGEAGGMLPVDQFGSVKVGAQVGINQDTGYNDRGAYEKTQIGISGSTKLNAAIAEAKGKLGVTLGGQTKAIGLNASNLVSNKASKVRQESMDMPKEFEIFNKKRTEILEQAKNLKRNLVDFEKLCKRYSNVSDIRLTFSYIDPKYNLEKAKTIGFSGNIGASAKNFANILSLKIKANHNTSIYKRNNDIYNFIKNTDLSSMFDNFDAFKQVAILCNKYDVIKDIYLRNDKINRSELVRIFSKFCEKYGGFTSFDNFLNTIEYYSEILQNMDDSKNKKMSKQMRDMKKKIENQFRTNGRADTLLIAYFIGNGYLVLFKNDQDHVNRLKSAYEKIALLLDESKSITFRRNKGNQYCKVFENNLSMGIAENFMNLCINNVSGSPYIYDNGTEISIDLDLSKINQTYDKIKKATNNYDDIKTFLKEKGIINDKALTCLSGVEQLLMNSKSDIIKKLEFNKTIFKNLILSLKLIKQTMDNGEKSLAFSKPIMQKMSQLLTSAKNVKSRVRFVFRIVKSSNKLEFIGVKVLNEIKNNIDLKTSKISDNLPIEASFSVGMKRFIDNGFTISNGRSMFLFMKNIIDYCFIKEADFGQGKLSLKGIREFIGQSFSEEYMNGLFMNFRKGAFTNIIQLNLDHIMKVVGKRDNLGVEKLKNLIGNGVSNIDKSQFMEALAIYGNLIFNLIAKPHNENTYFHK